MTKRNYFRLTIAAISIATAILFASNSEAELTFHVVVDTSQLIGNPNAPFSIDFQFNSGNTLTNNTAIISNFTFGGMGGAPFGSATTIGGASGSLSSMVSFSDTNAFNEFYQSFAAGSSLGFDVTLSLNLDAGMTPDAFSFSLLDSSLANITTNGLGDSLLLVNINSSSPSPQAFAGTGAYGGVTVSATVVPEPSTVALLGFVGVGVVVFGRRIASRHQA